MSFGLYKSLTELHPKSMNICAPGLKKYLLYIASKSAKLWTTKFIVVVFLSPNAPSVSDDTDVIPAAGFKNLFTSSLTPCSFGNNSPVM